MTTSNRADNVRRLLAPRSVAIVGVSKRPEAAGRRALRNLLDSGFTGDVYLVGRSNEPIDGLPCYASVADLPVGIDLAVLTTPAQSILESVRECGERGIGAAVIFAAGFGETGHEGALLQGEIVKSAREAGVVLLGPNCTGFENQVDKVLVNFMDAPIDGPPAPPNSIALIGQSGGMLRNAALSVQSRERSLSYLISTGNEADLSAADFIQSLATDASTKVIAVYAEKIADTAAFTAAVQSARANGKSIVLLHPGRSSRAQAVTQSHTGSLVGDHAAMNAYVEKAGAIVAGSFDEFIDLIELCAVFEPPQNPGVAVVSGSGGYNALSIDYCEEIGLYLPPLNENTEKVLREILPDYVTPQNPLDTSTAPAFDPDVMRTAIAALGADPAIGTIVTSLPAHSGPASVLVEKAIAGAAESGKPLVVTTWGDSIPFHPEFSKLVRGSNVVVARSSDRAFRALLRWSQSAVAMARGSTHPATNAVTTALLPGALSEWESKKLVAALGLPVPTGALAANGEEAATIAARIGYPVVVKAQSPKLLHKSDVGGVIVNIKDENALRAAYDRLLHNVAQAAPTVRLDGVLVEAMGASGIELIVGARRDEGWGPLVTVGLGGVWVEVLADVRTFRADLDADGIRAELLALRSARLLAPFRGEAAADLDALVEAILTVGQLMIQRPEISEIDINPLVVHRGGGGVTALDALIVAK